jgi:type IV pilus assembly protein PilC
MKAKPRVQVFRWEGISREGKRIAGELKATSIVLAKAQLMKEGILVKKLVNPSKSLLFIFSKKKKIKSADITLFSRQLATMMEAGIPLLQSFDIISKSQAHTGMRSLIEDLRYQIETGLTLAEAFKLYPLLFNDLYCNLIKAGESSGTLELMLKNLATYREKMENIKRKIKKAMVYPAIVVSVGLIVSAVLLIFVVPQFQTLFTSAGAQLPIFTLMVIKVSEFFQKYWFIILSSMLLAAVLIHYSYRRSKRFRQMLDHLIFKVPVIGQIVKNAVIARFARTLSITFAAGLPLYDALSLVEGAVGNIIYADATAKIREEVGTGQTMKIAMTNTHIFPNMVIQMIAIGEESGSMEKMLGKVANYYEDEVDSMVDNLSTLIEPLIICILGVLVGGLVVAMYLPIFKLGSVF